MGSEESVKKLMVSLCWACNWSECGSAGLFFMMRRRQLIPERPCAFLCWRQSGSCPLLHIHDEMLQELRNKKHFWLLNALSSQLLSLVILRVGKYEALKCLRYLNIISQSLQHCKAQHCPPTDLSFLVDKCSTRRALVTVDIIPKVCKTHL